MSVIKGKFAVTVTESDRWLRYADLKDTKLSDVLEEAKEYAKKHKEWVVVYKANEKYVIMR